MNEHRWSGWPGAYCLDCGAEDPREIAIATGRVYFGCGLPAGCGCPDPDHWLECPNFGPHYDPPLRPEEMECPMGWTRR
jgi:hypothetical protein